jgi:hypothetical protein
VKTARAKNYTKAEVKILKDMTLSDQQVAEMVNRSRQAVYCKRWTMKLYGNKKSKSLVRHIVSQEKPEVQSNDSIQVKAVVEHIMKSKQFKKLVVGNITIDLENKVVTVNI